MPVNPTLPLPKDTSLGWSLDRVLASPVIAAAIIKPATIPNVTIPISPPADTNKILPSPQADANKVPIHTPLSVLCDTVMDMFSDNTIPIPKVFIAQCEAGNVQGVLFLLNIYKGPKDPLFGATTLPIDKGLEIACTKGYLELVKCLCPLTKPDVEHTVLRVAASNKHRNIVEYLLSTYYKEYIPAEPVLPNTFAKKSPGILPKDSTIGKKRSLSDDTLSEKQPRFEAIDQSQKEAGEALASLTKASPIMITLPKPVCERIDGVTLSQYK